MSLPATFNCKPVILWTPDTATSFVAANEAFIAANPTATEFDPGVVYVNANGAIVSPVAGFPVGGNVMPLAETESGYTSSSGDKPDEATQAVVEQAHISEFRRLLDEVESIPAHIREFFHEHFGKHVA